LRCTRSSSARGRGLYEGDAGVALYVKACLDVDDRCPLLDVL